MIQTLAMQVALEKHPAYAATLEARLKEDTSTLPGSFSEIKYEEGFIAYLNGVGAAENPYPKQGQPGNFDNPPYTPSTPGSPYTAMRWDEGYAAAAAVLSTT